MGKHLRTPFRAFASEIVKADALAREVVVKDEPVGFEL